MGYLCTRRIRNARQRVVECRDVGNRYCARSGAQHAVGPMKARRTPPFDPMQVYRNRDYVQHRLDRGVFEQINRSGLDASTLAMWTTGCIDAIDSMPGGANKASEHGSIQVYMQRDDYGTSPADRAWRERVAAEIIAEILAEEKNR